MIVLWFLAFLWLLLYSIKFFKIYRFQHKWIFMFLVMINLSILMRMGNFIQELSSRMKNCERMSPKCVDVTFSFFSVLSFISAALFHQFNWQYQILEINMLISRVKNYKLILDAFLVISQFILFWMLISLVISSWATDSKGEILIIIYSYIMASLYIIFACIFAITAYIYLLKLRLFSANKAKQMKNRVILGSALIWSPLFIRGTFLIIRNQLDFEENFVKPSLKNDDWGLPLFIFSYYCLYCFIIKL